MNRLKAFLFPIVSVAIILQVIAWHYGWLASGGLVKVPRASPSRFLLNFPRLSGTFNQPQCHAITYNYSKFQNYWLKSDGDILFSVPQIDQNVTFEKTKIKDFSIDITTSYPGSFLHSLLSAGKRPWYGLVTCLLKIICTCMGRVGREVSIDRGSNACFYYVPISLSTKVLYKHQYKEEVSLRLFLIEIQLLYYTGDGKSLI